MVNGHILYAIGDEEISCARDYIETNIFLNGGEIIDGGENFTYKLKNPVGTIRVDAFTREVCVSEGIDNKFLDSLKVCLGLEDSAKGVRNVR